MNQPWSYMYSPSRPLLPYSQALAASLSLEFFWSLQHAPPSLLVFQQADYQVLPYAGRSAVISHFSLPGNTPKVVSTFLFFNIIFLKCFIYPCGKSNFPVCIFNLFSNLGSRAPLACHAVTSNTKTANLSASLMTPYLASKSPYPSVYLTLPLGCLICISDFS